MRAAVEDSDAAYLWVLELEEKGKSQEDFLKCPKKFLSLDAKVAKAVTTLLENHNGDLSSRVLNLKDKRAKNGKICRGRELLYMVYDTYTSDPSFGALCDIQDLIGVKLINDKIESFLNRWDHVLIHLT